MAGANGEALPFSLSPHSHLSPEPQLCTPLCSVHPSPTMDPISHGNRQWSGLSYPITSCSPKGAKRQIKIRVYLTPAPQYFPGTTGGGCKHPAQPPAICPQRNSPAPLSPSPLAPAQGDNRSLPLQKCPWASVYPRLLLQHKGMMAGEYFEEELAWVDGFLEPAEQ